MAIASCEITLGRDRAASIRKIRAINIRKMQSIARALDPKPKLLNCRPRHMSIYLEADDVLDHMFNACSIDQVHDFIPDRRGFRLHGHSTSIRLERAFWNVLEAMASELDMTLPELITRIHDQCMIANDKNLASCLRVICLKYLNVYAR